MLTNAASLSISAAAAVLSAMGNERRLQTLMHLLNGEAAVNDLVEVIGLSQSALSQHLAVLRRAKLVKTRRQAQTVYYSILSPAVREILGALDRAHLKRVA